MTTKWIAIGAFWAAVGVGLGAFGAHGLKKIVTPELLENWQTSVHYHLITALGLVLHGLFQRASSAKAWPACILLAGSLAFSGSLYAYVLGGPHAVVFVTPVGGVRLIAGWLGFAFQAARAR